jgi:hypothetical protein
VSAPDLESRVKDLEARLGKLEAPEKEAAKKDLRLTLLPELGAALRFRSEPEHLYTAAALGGFGAVAWGVATLQPGNYFDRPLYERPAVVAAIGTLVLAIAIVAKICREHTKYAALKKEQKNIADKLDSSCGEIITPNTMRSEAGGGYIWSIAVVSVAAIGAIAFCLSVAGPLR